MNVIYVSRTLIAAALAALAFVFAASAAELALQTSSDYGVTVSVAPNLQGPSFWTFTVQLDTHSQALDDDLVASSVLVDAAGKRHAPMSWEGAGPGGHHREGVLRFPAIAPHPAFIELRIQRNGETAPRSFRWQL